ncbi:MAG TPA: YfiR family protein [Burkholderiaceae bacterium]|nr:YfiR family protein [Burkholderiaceae bacterium]
MAPVNRRALAQLALFAAFTIVALAAAASAAADSHSTALERRVKAAFVFKFVGFVEWPPAAFEDAEEPLTFGVLGDDEFASELAAVIQGRRALGRALRVRTVRPGDPLESLQVLYVARGDTERLAQIARQLQREPLLIISDAPDGLARGSVINFLLVDDRVRFEVALDAAERAGLRLSSRLLSVAYRVRPASP